MNDLRIEKKIRKINFEIQGTGNETRSFIYIDDFTEGLMKVINQGSHLNVYHIGTSDEIKISDLANKIAKILNVEVNVVPGELTQGGTLRRCPDISKLQSLGFNPEISLDEGLEFSKDWYVANKHLRP